MSSTSTVDTARGLRSCKSIRLDLRPGIRRSFLVTRVTLADVHRKMPGASILTQSLPSLQMHWRVGITSPSLMERTKVRAGSPLRAPIFSRTIRSQNGSACGVCACSPGRPSVRHRHSFPLRVRSSPLAAPPTALSAGSTSCICAGRQVPQRGNSAVCGLLDQARHPLIRSRSLDAEQTHVCNHESILCDGKDYALVYPNRPGRRGARLRNATCTENM